jgi:hypothetical protein
MQVIVLAPLLLVLPYTAMRALRGPVPARLLAAFLFATYLWFGALAAFEQIRWTYYLHALYPIALTPVLADLILAARRLRVPILVALGQVVAVLLFVLAPPLAFVLLPQGPATSMPGCSAADVAEALEAAPHDAHDIALASVFVGSEVLYRTDFDVVIGPYHRNANGTRDSEAIMGATDFDEARRVAARRGIRFIATCPGGVWYPRIPGDVEGTLYQAIERGEPPAWLRRVPPRSPDQVVEIWRLIPG